MEKGFAKKYTIQELAVHTQSEVIGDSAHIISGVDSLETASSEDASFSANPKYREAMLSSKAGVICINKQTELLPGKNYLRSDNPSRAFQTIVELFLINEYNHSGFGGIHPTAVIHPTAQVGNDVQIGPYAVVDHGAIIGDRTCILAHVSIGAGTTIGADCLFYPHVVIREKCIIGNRVVLQPGAIIGSCGFGFTTDAKGKHTKLEQLGNVIIEDDVEIGSATIIDRARFKSTKIAQNTKIDNLVQIAHNVQLGPSNIIVSQTGIAGSTKTGQNVVIGGQSGIVGHIEIGSGVMIASRGGVSKSILTPGKYAGVPVMPLAEYNRNQVFLRNLEEHLDKIKNLEKRLSALEEQ